MFFPFLQSQLLTLHIGSTFDISYCILQFFLLSRPYDMVAICIGLKSSDSYLLILRLRHHLILHADSLCMDSLKYAGCVQVSAGQCPTVLYNLNAVIVTQLKCLCRYRGPEHSVSTQHGGGGRPLGSQLHRRPLRLPETADYGQFRPVDVQRGRPQVR